MNLHPSFLTCSVYLTSVKLEIWYLERKNSCFIWKKTDFWYLYWILYRCWREEKTTKKAAHWMHICFRGAENFTVFFFFVISSIFTVCKRNLRKWCLYSLLIYIHFWTDVCFEDLSTIIVKRLRLEQIRYRSHQSFLPFDEVSWGSCAVLKSG